MSVFELQYNTLEYVMLCMGYLSTYLPIFNYNICIS